MSRQHKLSKSLSQNMEQYGASHDIKAQECCAFLDYYRFVADRRKSIFKRINNGSYFTVPAQSFVTYRDDECSILWIPKNSRLGRSMILLAFADSDFTSHPDDYEFENIPVYREWNTDWQYSYYATIHGKSSNKVQYVKVGNEGFTLRFV